MERKTDVLIVGAGFAGAATAYHLSAHFRGRIRIVEKEKLPGFHASGRNASLLLQSTASPIIRQVAAASRLAFEEHREKIGFQQSGSLQLGSTDQLEEVRDPVLVSSEYRTPARVREWIPALQGYSFEAGLWTPSDGVIDVSRLLDFYLEGARSRGVEVLLDTEIVSVEGSDPLRVMTSQGETEAGVLVNAAGAWASQVATLAGMAPLTLFPLKRHLFILDDIPTPVDDLPFVWSLTDHFYFRPESGGLLFSICDEERTKSLEPTINSEISEDLAELIWKRLPALHEVVQRRVWSCFRTKTPDDHFVIGWDPHRSDCFWVGGLGGHGMGCSWEAGRLAANALMRSPEPLPSTFLPDRDAVMRVNTDDTGTPVESP